MNTLLLIFGCIGFTILVLYLVAIGVALYWMRVERKERSSEQRESARVYPLERRRNFPRPL